MLSPEQEIRELRSAFRSDRDPDGRAFASLADAYRRSGDVAQALQLLQEGLGHHPRFATGHVVAAWVHRDRGSLDEAEAAFRRVLELDGENGEALRGLGELAAERGRDEEAVSWLRRLSDLEPGNEALARRIEELEAGGGGMAAEFEGAWAASPGGAGGEGDLDADFDLALDDLPGSGPETEVAATDDLVTTTDDLLDTGSVLETADAVRDAGESGEGLDPVRVGGPEDPEDAGDGAAVGGPGADADALAEFDADALGETEEGPEAEADEAEAEGGDGVYTRTMADLYARQGLHDRALHVYEHLAERAPGDEELQRRVRELRERAEASPAEPRAPAEPPASRPASPPAATGGAVGTPEAREDELEALARDWAEGPGASEEVSTPFAWGEEEEEGAAAAPPGEPVRAYFHRLLAWEPSHRRSSGGGVAGAAAAAAPAEPPAAADTEEPVVDVADLAPEAGTGDPVVDVADLAPAPEGSDPVVDIADLAPGSGAEDPVVEISDLAPEPAGPAAAAPGERGGESDADEGEGGAASGDAFSRWLEHLK